MHNYIWLICLKILSNPGSLFASNFLRLVLAASFALIANSRRLSNCCDDHKSKKAVNLLRWSQIQEGCQPVAMITNPRRLSTCCDGWSQIQEGCQLVAMITNSRRMPTCTKDYIWLDRVNMQHHIWGYFMRTDILIWHIFQKHILFICIMIYYK